MTSSEIKRKLLSLTLEMSGLMPEEWLVKNNEWVERTFTTICDKLDELDRLKNE